jgi:hypothetical protein
MILDENFSYGYDGGLFNLRASSESNFECHYNKSKRNFKSLREEAKVVCEKISDYCRSIKKIPVVLLSGGLDSEVVVRSFIDSGREFKAVSNRFLQDLNIHEIDYIERLKKKFNFDHTYVDIDIVKFYGSQRCKDLIDISKCTKPEMIPTMELIHYVYNHMDGIPVLGNGDFYVSKDNEDGKIVWNYYEYEYILAWMRFCVDQHITAATNFFQYTPEIVLSVGRDSIMSDLFAKSPEEKKSSRSKKYIVYKKNWIDIELRQKFHGCENIMSICDELRNTICLSNSQYTDIWKMPVDNFLSMIETYSITESQSINFSSSS